MDEKLKEQLEQLKAQLQEHFTKAQKEQEQQGTVSAGLKANIEKVQAQVDEIDKKLAGGNPGAPGEQKDAFEEAVESDESVKQLVRDRRGRAVLHLTGKAARSLMERKTTITSAGVGYTQTGVLQIERLPGITRE